MKENLITEKTKLTPCNGSRLNATATSGLEGRVPQLQKASHAASKSLLFSLALNTFQAISVIFLTVQAQEEEYQTSGCVGEQNL